MNGNELDKLRHTIRLMISDPSKAFVLLTPSSLADDEVYRPLLLKALRETVNETASSNSPVTRKTLHLTAAKLHSCGERNTYIIAANLRRALASED